jgi:3-dehydroquinate synthetase
LETAGRYGLLHGEAVAVCLVFATRLAASLGRLPDGEVDRCRTMLTRLGLPTSAPGGLPASELTALMQRDKKASGGLTFVLPGPSGTLELVDDPPAAALTAAFAAVAID